MSETSDDRVKTDTGKRVFTHTMLTIETADVLSVQTVISVKCASYSYCKPLGGAVCDNGPVSQK